MSVSPIASQPVTSATGQTPSDRQAQAAAANDSAANTAAQPDRVDISAAAQEQIQTAQNQNQAQTLTSPQVQTQAATAASVMPNARYWTPNLSPGQKGYVPQPLSAQFDKDGKAIKSGNRIDTTV